MRPRINPGDEPPFHQLDEYLFQKLCRDLFVAELGITSAIVYGARGERQLGIDVRAQRYHPTAIEVGQCKRYEHFSPTEIRTASDEFLAHWDYWQTQNVRRFILFVTADVSSRRHIAVIDAERERFRTRGVVYEVWSSETIQAKLRNHPAIVARYLYPPAYWIEVVCGVTGASPWRHLNAPISSPETGSATYFADQLDVLSGHIATDIDQQIAEMRRKIRAGRSDEASARLQQLKLQQAVWDRLGASLQARLLRVEARIELHQNRNTYQATQLADQANRLVPDEPDDGLQAMLTFYASGPEAALAVVSAGGTLERDNLRAAFLLELGRIEEARAVLDPIETQYNPTAETFRLRALLRFVTGNGEQARFAAQRALALEPEGEAVRLVAACSDYFSSIAVCSCPVGLPALPEPVDWVFVKRDDTSLARLRAATFAPAARRIDQPLRAAQPTLADLVAYGQRLLAALGGAALQATLAPLPRAPQPASLIAIHTAAAELAAIPWEYLNDGADFLIFNYLFVREVPNAPSQRRPTRPCPGDWW